MQDMVNVMEPRDLMITDKAFRSLRDELQNICAWVKPRGINLSFWQNQESKEVSQQRGK